ncbi:putative glyoxalase superfamily protein PhnB [Nakamurella sp. UYEF19]|uniref:VOC family protein n=1 Tax=Nakamurella sp. UYEF19 TaxID=1756392 RepID=UPI00339B8045
MTNNPGTWPTLSYRDAPAAIGYLTGVLGFTESVVYPGEDRAVSHAELLWPEGGGIMFGSDAGEKSWSGGAGGPGQGTVYLVTTDVAALHTRVQEAGWTISRPFAQTDYGSAEFGFHDPEGNAWSIGDYRGHQAG